MSSVAQRFTDTPFAKLAKDCRRRGPKLPWEGILYHDTHFTLTAAVFALYLSDSPVRALTRSTGSSRTRRATSSILERQAKSPQEARGFGVLSRTGHGGISTMTTVTCCGRCAG